MPQQTLPGSPDALILDAMIRSASAGNEAEQAILDELTRTQASNVPVPQGPGAGQSILKSLLYAASSYLGNPQTASQNAALINQEKQSLAQRQQQARLANLQQEGYAALRKQNLSERLSQIRERAGEERRRLDLALANLREGRSERAAGQKSSEDAARQQHQFRLEEIRANKESAKTDLEANPFVNAKGEQTPFGAKMALLLSLLKSGETFNDPAEPKLGTRLATPQDIDQLIQTMALDVMMSGLRHNPTGAVSDFLKEFDAAVGAHQQAKADIMGQRQAYQEQVSNEVRDAISGRGVTGSQRTGLERRALGLADLDQMEELFDTSIAETPASVDLPGLFLEGRPSIFDAFTKVSAAQDSVLNR